ncbi:MAG: AAA family ATPase, partial [Planctomycetota bacterium]
AVHPTPMGKKAKKKAAERRVDTSVASRGTSTPSTDSASEADSLLRRFAIREVSGLVALGELQAGIGIDGSVEKLLDLVDAGRSAVIVGGSGVGKTTLVEGVAAALWKRRSEAKSSAQPKCWRVMEFSLRSLRQRAKNEAQTVKIFERFTAALLARPEVLPFIRDLHVAWSLDLEPRVDELFLRVERPWLCEGEAGPIECMLRATPSLEAAVTMHRVEEPDAAAAMELAQGWARRVRDRRGLEGDWRSVVSEEALAGAIDVARRFHVQDRLPRTLIGPLNDLNERNVRCEEPQPIEFEDVVARVAETQGLPRSLVDPRETIDLVALEARLEKSVVGQSEAVRALVDSVGLFKSGLSDPRRAIGSFLFTGPTGVGKTQLARALSADLLGTDDGLLRMNMSDHQSARAAETIFGKPYAMTSGARQGLLTRTLSGRGFGVLLLDEFEKAHPVVHDHFMQLFDEGQFVNGTGQTISCRSFIIIATSNAGADAWVRESLGFRADEEESRIRDAVDRALGNVFRAELLNRFDQVIPFRPLSRTTVEAIARRELNDLANRSGLAQRGLSLEVDDSVVTWIAEEGYDVELGARPLKRAIERKITAAMARSLMSVDRRSTPGELRLTLRSGSVVCQQCGV